MSILCVAKSMLCLVCLVESKATAAGHRCLSDTSTNQHPKWYLGTVSPQYVQVQVVPTVQMRTLQQRKLRQLCMHRVHQTALQSSIHLCMTALRTRAGLLWTGVVVLTCHLFSVSAVVLCPDAHVVSTGQSETFLLRHSLTHTFAV
jgi:hypothetical protein